MAYEKYLKKVNWAALPSFYYKKIHQATEDELYAAENPSKYTSRYSRHIGAQDFHVNFSIWNVNTRNQYKK